MQLRELLNPVPLNFSCDLYELAAMLNDTKCTRTLDISEPQRLAWLYGHEPVPPYVSAAFQLIRPRTLGAYLGRWVSYAVCSEHLANPYLQWQMQESEFVRLPAYRRAARLAVQQAELIVRLMIERDFNRSQCHR